MSNEIKRHNYFVLALFVAFALLFAASCFEANAAKKHKKKVAKISHRDSVRLKYFYLEAVKCKSLDKHAEAVSLLEHCMSITQDAPEVLYMLSNYDAAEKNDSLGLARMQRAVSLSPDNYDFLDRLAEGYIVQKDWANAAQCYEKLYAQDKSRSIVLKRLAALYDQLKQYDSEISAIERLELLQGDSEETTLQKMSVYYKQGKTQEQLSAIRSLAENHPLDMDYRVLMGNFLLQQGNKEEALEQYLYALKEEPKNVSARLSLMDYYAAEGQDSLAKRLREDVLLSNEATMKEKITLLQQAIKQNEAQGGDSTEILSLFHRMLLLKQSEADIAELQVAYMELKKMPSQEIERAVDQVLSIQPDNASAWFKKIMAHWSEDSQDTVIKQCRLALQYCPDKGLFYYFLGLALHTNLKDTEALETLKKGEPYFDDDESKSLKVEFYSLLGAVYNALGKNDECFEAYEKGLQTDPNSVEILNNYAYFLSLTGKELQKAERMSFKAISQEPNNPTYLDTYAWVLFLEGRQEEAKIYIEDAIKKLQDEPSDEIFEHAGDIHATSGDKEKAVEYWQKAVEEGSTSRTINQKIKQKRYIR